MPRKKKLPECIRRHGSGFRAVCGDAGARERSPTYATVEEAVEWRNTYRGALAQPSDRPIVLTLKEGLELVCKDVADSGGRADTGRFYRNHARPLFEALGGENVLVHTVKQAQLRAYIDGRRRDGVSVPTIVGKELFVLRRIVKLAREAGYILPRSPFDGLKVPKGRMGRYEFLTRQRLQKLVATMRSSAHRRAAWHADLVEVMFGTGLRRAELARVTVADIDLQARRIFVDGKTGNRYQPFGAGLDAVLQRLIAAAQPNGKLVSSYRTIEKLFERWRRRLAEPSFSPHVIRHSYATEMAERVSPLQLMALMDHKDLKQTSRYFHGRDALVRGALDGLQLGPQSPPRTERAAGRT